MEEVVYPKDFKGVFDSGDEFFDILFSIIHSKTDASRRRESEFPVERGGTMLAGADANFVRRGPAPDHADGFRREREGDEAASFFNSICSEDMDLISERFRAADRG
jgi:hypothetical protein